MATVDKSKVFDLVTVDPNFSMPPGVTDLGYLNPDEKTDLLMARDSETGQLVTVTYDESEQEDGEYSEQQSTVQTNLLPPDNVTVISQKVRLTSDGRAVVDVILEVEDIPGVTGYEVGITKV